LSIRVNTLAGKELVVGTLLGQPLPGVYVGSLELPLDAVLDIAYYVLTNTNLVPDDPRLKFVQAVKKMRIVKGWNAKYKRLAMVLRSAPPRRRKKEQK